MDWLMIVLRLVHIFAGIMWVGSGLFLLFLLVPTVRKLGPEGQGFFTGFLKYSGFVRLIPIVSLLTTVAGLWLYYKVSDGFNADWMKSDGGIVLSIGSVAGVLAFGHAATATGPASGQIVKLGDAIDAAAGPPSPEQIAQMQALQRKMTLNGWISVGLLVIAVIGMASARYM
jgi:uncharacterized membrane protein